MGAASPEAGYHLVPFGYLVLNGDLQVRESFAHASGELLDSFHTTYVLVTSGLVAYVVWGVDLFSSVEVSLCPDLLKLPTRHGLVLFRRHHTSCSFPTRSLGAVTAIVAKAARCRYIRKIRQCEVRRIHLPGTSVNKSPLDAPDASGWHHGCCRLGSVCKTMLREHSWHGTRRFDR